MILPAKAAGFSFPTGPVIIQAGLTLYDVNPNVFEVTGDVFFDTSGKFLVIGTATVGDSFSVGAKIFTDLSPLFQGEKSLNILFLVQEPAQPNSNNTPPTFSLYGFVTFSDANGVFQITIAGEEDFNVLGALKVQVIATVNLTFTADSFNMTLANTPDKPATLTIPAIQSTPLGTAAGSLTIEHANGTIDIWGGFLLTTNLTALNPEGIYSSAQTNIKLNTTDEVKTVNLPNGPLSLDPESFSLFIHGVAEFKIDNQVVFELDGALAFQISGSSITIFVQAQLLLGPDSHNPIMAFNANGLIYVQLVKDDSDPNNIINPGFAAKMTLTQGAGTTVPNGITFGENWLLAMNTTGGTITYSIPAPAVTNPPSPAIPTVLGPDYSSSNPLALTSYETGTNPRTLVIPSGAPVGRLSDYRTWVPNNNDPYFLVLGRGSVTILNAYTLTGNLNILATIGASGPSFLLDASTSETVALGGHTIFSFTTAGGIQLSKSGVAAALVLQPSGGVPSALGFGLSARLYPGAEHDQPPGHDRRNHIAGEPGENRGGRRPDVAGRCGRSQRHFQHHRQQLESDCRRRCQCNVPWRHVHRKRICRRLLRQSSRSGAGYRAAVCRAAPRALPRSAPWAATLSSAGPSISRLTPAG